MRIHHAPLVSSRRTARRLSIPTALRTGIALGLAMLAYRGHAQTAYSITDLGTLGTGPVTQATAINNAGQIVGVSDTNGAFTPHAFLYSNGTMTDLGVFVGGGPTSYAAAINDSGLIVGIAHAASGNTTVAHGFSTTTAGGPLVDLGTVGAGVQSDARGVANNGVIVGQATLNGVGQGTAFYYSGGTMTPFGGTTTNANGVNVVGGVTTIVGYTDRVVTPGVGSPYTIIDAFTYTIGGSVVDIGNLGHDVELTISKANAISSTGIVVGESSIDSLNYISHAFSYTPGGAMIDLGTLGGDSSSATAINSAGLIVGEADLFPNDSTHHAFSFLTGGTMTDLNTLIPGNSGWELIGALGVNDGGQIVGYGQINGDIHGYVLTPVPEPSTCAVILGTCALGLAALRHRQRTRQPR